jgi:two-component system sensor histidine kinase CpxA
MRNLYFRFFVTVWLSMVAVMLVTVVTTGWLVMQRRDAELVRQDDLQRQAQDRLTSEGIDGLRGWLRQQIPLLAPDRIYISDEQGHDLIDNRPLPPFILARMGRQPLPDVSFTEAAAARRDDRLLSKLNAPGGASYFLSLSAARPPFGIFGTAETPYIWGVLALLVSATVCFLLARYLSAPIQLLRNATHSIAAGDLSVQVAPLMAKRRDELATLAVDFDAMAVRLRALLDSHQQLLRDVSHELRSPLARLQIALGIARRPNADVEQGFDRIEQEAQRLDELIGEILSLCRLDDPAHTMHSERVEVDELLEPMIEDARIEAEARQVQIELRAQPNLALDGDRELLHRALENVLRNAVRFSPEGGKIEVAASRAQGRLHIDIRDHGPGVPTDHLDRIFEPFHRVGEARDRESGGYGVGLAITSRVVKLHNGRVKAANAEGGGLRVQVELPLAQAA